MCIFLNVLEAYEIDTPYNDVDSCSHFIIDDVLIPFCLHNVMTNGQQYTFSMWVKADVEPDITKNVLIRGETIPVTNEWTYHEYTFPTYSTDLHIYFTEIGSYYIYHPQLERGAIATDWSESPLDVNAKILKASETANDAQKGVQELYIKLEDSIEMVVEALNNGTMLEQTETGWNFVGGGTRDKLKELSDALNNLETSNKTSIKQLQDKIAENDKLSNYVRIDETGEQPIIKMGTYITDAITGESAFGKFSLQITNTAIQFLADELPIAWISNQELHISKAVIEDELSVGGFVLKKHGNRGNVGFLWKGVTG